jgi:hypothetical protein
MTSDRNELPLMEQGHDAAKEECRRALPRSHAVAEAFSLDSESTVILLDQVAVQGFFMARSIVACPLSPPCFRASSYSSSGSFLLGFSKPPQDWEGHFCELCRASSNMLMASQAFEHLQ